ncbi:uncharacterized protein LOC107965722 [Apis mellifera]|uniref:Uncharacterized protein LOC107965722 n=1 Tax=Apis mellifera TaxID=7460 RepID=A0A7M7MV18_APIME|nr:uncharacterized protein LOC107965722 [Apis mellifera]XP_026301551.1 uncharacterized protein LOC107965722 [Apis mellifera]XP_026301552.1 uncharacterized protein LOC107965722 [Apis mellifera]|eukprot:XP_026301550.1 uncharacterized protein LOC107965722 [Apis mellifera]
MEMCRLASRWLRRLLVYSSGSAITSRPALCSSSLCCSSKNRSKLGHRLERKRGKRDCFQRKLQQRCLVRSKGGIEKEGRNLFGYPLKNALCEKLFALLAHQIPPPVTRHSPPPPTQLQSSYSPPSFLD